MSTSAEGTTLRDELPVGDVAPHPWTRQFVSVAAVHEITARTSSGGLLWAVALAEKTRTIRLAREVRFALGDEAASGPANTHAGFPRPDGATPFYRVSAELVGLLDPRTSCLAHIKTIDEVIRTEMLETIREGLADGRCQPGEWLVAAWPAIARRLADDSRARLDALTLHWTPFHKVTYRGEIAMTNKRQNRGMRGGKKTHAGDAAVYLTEQFEFSAAHRLWSAELSDTENACEFGKCANPAGHGHNYVVEVTVACSPQAVPLARLERIVKAAAIDRLDHRNLNVDCEEFRALNPTVENVCRVIFDKLERRSALGRTLVAVRLFETPKTWAECRR